MGTNTCNYGSGIQGGVPIDFIGGNQRGFDGFNMNAMAQFAGMMSMFASYMAMNACASMGNFGANQMRNMANAIGNLAGNEVGGQNNGSDNLSLSNKTFQVGNLGSDVGNFGTCQTRNICEAMGSNQMSGQNYVGASDLSSSNNVGQPSNDYASEMVNTGHHTFGDSPFVGAQDFTSYYQQMTSDTGDMSGYAKMMSAMFGVNPENVHAALYNSYYGSSSNTSQFGVYDNQTTSMYGPTKNTSAGDTAQSYKPY